MSPILEVPYDSGFVFWKYRPTRPAINVLTHVSRNMSTSLWPLPKKVCGKACDLCRSQLRISSLPLRLFETFVPSPQLNQYLALPGLPMQRLKHRLPGSPGAQAISCDIAVPWENLEYWPHLVTAPATINGNAAEAHNAGYSLGLLLPPTLHRVIPSTSNDDYVLIHQFLHQGFYAIPSKKVLSRWMI